MFFSIVSSSYSSFFPHSCFLDLHCMHCIFFMWCFVISNLVFFLQLLFSVFPFFPFSSFLDRKYDRIRLFFLMKPFLRRWHTSQNILLNLFLIYQSVFLFDDEFRSNYDSLRLINHQEEFTYWSSTRTIGNSFFGCRSGLLAPIIYHISELFTGPIVLWFYDFFPGA